MPQKVLVAGFDRFGHLRRPNPSSEIVLPAVEAEYGDGVETLILPTEHNTAARLLGETIREISPASVAIFGMAAGRRVRLERQAKNRRFNVLIPDNKGIRTAGHIDRDGPRALSSTLPFEELHARLSGQAIPVRYSTDAGTFVCNEVLYRALQQTEGSNIPTGLVHLGGGMSHEAIARAALSVVGQLLNNDTF